MKRIGIIGAMEEEVYRLKSIMTNTEPLIKTGMVFVKGRIHGKEVVVVRSGIGKVNAAICAQILVDLFGVDLIINTGVAGGLRNETNIGDVVISKDALHHDMDATGFGYERGMIPRMDSSIFEANSILVERAKEVCKRVNPGIQTFVGRILTGDQFISEQEKREELKVAFDGYCVEMEGAAIAHTATLNQIDFLIIRAISDKADNSAHMDYKTFELCAIDHSVRLLTELIGEL